MTPPADLVGFYYSLVKMVKEIDPLVDLIAKQDSRYDALMTDLFMNSLFRMDQDISKKMTELLKLELDDQRNLLVLLVKRFIHSLGAEFLNIRNVLYVWDHMIMRVYPMNIEIFIVMALSLICLKDNVLKVQSWDEFVDMYYKTAKMIDFRQFTLLYEENFREFNFYEAVYKDVDISGIEYSQMQEEYPIPDRSIINDMTKKATFKQPSIAKHSTLLNRLQKKSDESQLKVRDPELELAMQQNLKFEKQKYNEQMGMFPYMNMDEEDNEDLLE